MWALFASTSYFVRDGHFFTWIMGGSCRTSSQCVRESAGVHQAPHLCMVDCCLGCFPRPFCVHDSLHLDYVANNNRASKF